MSTTTKLTSIRENLNEEIIKMALHNIYQNEDVDFYHPEIFRYLGASTTQFINRDLATHV